MVKIIWQRSHHHLVTPYLVIPRGSKRIHPTSTPILGPIWVSLPNGTSIIGVRRISQWRGLHWWIQEFFVWVWHGEQEARAHNGGLAEPPTGSRGRAPGQGAKPPEAGAFLGPARPKEIANLLSFVLWVLISLITVWCRQLNWRQQSFQLEGNCMFSCIGVRFPDFLQY